jgi:hypothetical protein
MGFLDHSTNNIIIDAVLTDRGRELLAQNDGSFQIVRYAFADDEVDYSIISKFGRTIGKEKIEKNTPVFEAQTISGLGLRHPLCSYNDPNLITLPYFEIVSQSSIPTITSTANANVTVEQRIDDTRVTTSQKNLLRESMIRVEVDERFLTISGAGPAQTIPFGFTAVYDISMNDPGSGGALLGRQDITLVKSAVGSSYTQLMNTSNVVKTNVRISGITTGISKTFEVSVQY